MRTTETIDGIDLVITDPDLGSGGQGSAQKGVLRDDPAITAAMKILAAEADAAERTKALIALKLPQKNPYLAGPLAMAAQGGEIRHIAPFAPGRDLQSDKPRAFPQKLEIAHHLACQWTSLEEHGVAHGDIGPANITISEAGEGWVIDFDNAVLPGEPAPAMRGQHMMLAPELRGGKAALTIESDRFAWAVLFNLILLGRHPATGLAATPVELDREMTTGRWPERRRPRAKGETPFEALGPDLPRLFDQAFKRDPKARPSADAWRRGLLKAVNTIYIHTCRQAFVADPKRSRCPWCGKRARVKAPEATLVVALANGAPLTAPLKEGQAVLVGRRTIPALPRTVSGRHLEITRHKDRLLLRHVGRNPTLIQIEGRWFRLKETWIDLGAPILLRLADADLRITARKDAP